MPREPGLRGAVAALGGASLAPTLGTAGRPCLCLVPNMAKVCPIFAEHDTLSSIRAIFRLALPPAALCGEPTLAVTVDPALQARDHHQQWEVSPSRLLLSQLESLHWPSPGGGGEDAGVAPSHHN